MTVYIGLVFVSGMRVPMLVRTLALVGILES